jgi:hypothetical protein
MSATMEMYNQGKISEPLVITGVEHLLIFRCNPKHVCPGDTVRFQYEFTVEAITDGIHTCTYTDPIVIHKAIDKTMSIRSIIVHVDGEERTLEVSEEELTTSNWCN